jgi:N-methylhydantoinase A
VALEGEEQENMLSRLRVAVDIGGTFTDLSIAGRHGVITVNKTLTTPEEPALAVDTAVRETLSRVRVGAESIGQVVHATTLVTNAILERKGARTALLATRGFSDTLTLATEKRYDLYDLDIELPKPLVPRWLTFDVPERTLTDGTVDEPLDVEHVKRLATELDEAGVEAVAVTFLHSFTNPANERAARAAIRSTAPRLRVALSSEISPEIREYERATTTVASVYVQDVVERYLADLKHRLTAIGYEGNVYLMLSHGGLATVETAKTYPVRLLESGPAAGALAAAAFGASAEQPGLVSFDMGGTTAKLCLVEDGAPLVRPGLEVDRQDRAQKGSGLPLIVSTIDLVEVGVGGGSIARVDALGLVRTGPESAGAVPGPVCYGHGGSRPTITDADLVLGYLDPDYFLGGTMKLDLEAARDAIARHIAKPLDLSLERAALNIHQIANEGMANAARVHAVERGKDPTTMPLFAFGGAGAVHAVGVAHRLGSPLVVVPPLAGVMSTVGLLSAPLAFDFVRSMHTVVDHVDRTQVLAIVDDMKSDANGLLTGAGVPPSEVVHRLAIDARLIGQGHEINVGIEDVRSWPDCAYASFDAAYRRLYGRSGPDLPIEVLRWRLSSSGPRPALTLRPEWEASEGEAFKRTRRASLGPDSSTTDVDVYDRYKLPPGAAIEGPAIVEERESTSIVPYGATCHVSEDLALKLALGDNQG